MGLFDTITIDHVMLPKKWRGVEFQTKDLYKALESYKITPSGRLYRKHVQMEYRSDPKGYIGWTPHVLSTQWLRKTDLEGQVEVHSFDRQGVLVSLLLDFHRGVLLGLRRLRSKKKGP